MDTFVCPLDRPDASFFSDPYSGYRRLRNADPVRWSDAWGGWLVTGFDDVQACLRDARLSLGGGVTAVFEGIGADEREALAPLRRHVSLWVGSTDPPRHTRLRSMMTQALAPLMKDELAEDVRRVCESLIDARPRRKQMDVVADLASPLPAIVIAELFGTPAEDHRRFKGWSRDITSFLGGGRVGVETMLRAQSSILEMTAYLAELLARRRREPADDLMTHFLEVVGAGSELEEEFLANCVLLLFAGHETTTMLIANAVRALLDEPEALDRLRESPDLVGPAVEETLRFDSPIQIVRRQAREPLELGGRTIERGHVTWLVIGAANRDPARFADPDRFLIDRKDQRHLAFGAGLHYCLGAYLSRLEARVALDVLLRRLPSFASGPTPPAWVPNPTARMLQSLEISLEEANVTEDRSMRRPG